MPNLFRSARMSRSAVRPGAGRGAIDLPLVSLLAVLGAAVPVTSQAVVTGKFTVDNSYVVYVGTPTQVVTQVVPSLGSGLQAVTSTSSQDIKDGETFSFEPEPLCQIYVIAWSDDGTYQGMIGSFTGSVTLNTGDPSIRVLPAGLLPPGTLLDTPANLGNAQHPTKDDINRALAAGAADPTLWRPTTAGAWLGAPPDAPLGAPIGSAGTPYDSSFRTPLLALGIDPKARWIWYDSGKDSRPTWPTWPYVPFDGFNHDEFLIFRVPCAALNLEAGRICGTKWLDSDGDGVKETGEPGSGGWTIQLYSGVPDLAGNPPQPIATTQSAADGSYCFDLGRLEIPDSNGNLVFSVAEGPFTSGFWQQTFPQYGLHQVVLSSISESAMGLDFGNKSGCAAVTADIACGPKPGTYSGTFLVDSAVTWASLASVTAKASSGTVTAGNWNVPLQGSSPQAFTVSGVTDAAGSVCFDVALHDKGSANCCTVRQCFPLPPCPCPACCNYIHGAKYHDIDGDGRRDPGEPGLQGWQVHLITNGADALPAQVTDQFGNFFFGPGIAPGTYTVTETPQGAGWTQTEVPAPVIIGGSAGQVVTNVNIGNRSREARAGAPPPDARADADETGAASKANRPARSTRRPR